MNNLTTHVLLTRKEAAEILGISVNSFDKYFRGNPELKSLLIGTEIRYPYQLLMDFVTNQSQHHQ
ncbi:DNA-binding protein [Weissella confusa]|uniref:helix-turn-helix domain-containing protein n=1 Tax=Weissella confusa TaxID=1583 RepID=UPI00223B67D5|nr:helix-turn-helix domain-containing protein [Weissella confusa]MCT0042179.1 DNA-binding protein [Weissella confusa]